MILLLLTYLFKKFGHKLKLNSLLQRSRYSFVLQSVKTQNISAAQFGEGATL
jgi:hypothetical protein